METEIINYIIEAKKHGLTETEIKQNLLNAEWDATVIEQSFAFAKAEENRPIANRDEDISRPKEPSISSQVLGKLESPRLVHENLVISEENFQTSGGKSRLKKPLLIALFLVLLLAGAGYAFYVYSYNNPTKIWQKFQGSDKQKIYQNKFNVSFKDNGSLDSSLTEGLGNNFQLKDIKLSLDGNFYIDSTDGKNPQSSAELQYSFSSGNTSLTTGFEYKLINKVLYLNVGDNPLLNGIFQSLSPDKKIDWVKIDLNEAESQLSSASSTEASEFGKVFSKNLSDELTKLWQDANFVKIDKYLGKEKLGEVQTAHFANTLDKEALKQTLNDSINKITKAIVEQTDQIKSDDLAKIQLVVGGLIDKFEVKQFETWVGTRDFKLYRVKFVSNAPSVISLVKTASAESKESSRDSKRIADVRQIAVALELYYNDNNQYPDSENGQPKNFFPKYMTAWPPVPSPADGTCSNYYNSYWYVSKKVKSTSLNDSYQMTFCLGSTTGPYAAGIGLLSPSGIEDNIACPPATPEGKCNNGKTAEPPTSSDDKVKNFIDKLEYSAEFNLDLNYSDYDKPQNLEAPENSFDLLKELKNKPGLMTPAL